jgi:hypothetical protein
MRSSSRFPKRTSLIRIQKPPLITDDHAPSPPIEDGSARFNRRSRVIRFGGFLAALLLTFSFIASLTVARAVYPWVLINPEKDSRDADTRQSDEVFSRNLVFVINENEALFRHQMTWQEAPITKLLEMNGPFCEMHFDAVRPLDLTAEEKTVLIEYFKRGGFILFFIDAFPYDQDEFWAVKSWPLVDFLVKELPRDSDFSIARLRDDHPMFKIHYQSHVDEEIRHELRDNPYTPNRLGIYYKNRLCGFIMGNYNVVENGKWIAEPRPFSLQFSSELSGYERIVNVFVYSIVQ